MEVVVVMAAAAEMEVGGEGGGSVSKKETNGVETVVEILCVGHMGLE